MSSTPSRPAPRIALPASLPNAFTPADAVAAGVGRGRLRGRDLQHPFRSVITRVPVTAVKERCEALALRLRGPWWFSHATAAVLYRIPMPKRFEAADRPLDVSVLAPRTPPTAAGVTGHSISHPQTQVFNSPPKLRRIAPADVWCQLSTMLEREDLVAAGDYLLSGDAWDIDRRPLCTECQLREAAARYRGRRGAKKVAWALDRIRSGVDSRPESLLRLMLVAAGLPEPLIADPTAVDGGRVILHPDLKLPRWGTVFEYEGDGHRERGRWLSDVERYSLLRAAGWEVIQVTADDLQPRNRARFLRRVFEVLRRRGYPWRTLA
jgi:hypothetical protein